MYISIREYKSKSHLFVTCSRTTESEGFLLFLSWHYGRGGGDTLTIVVFIIPCRPFSHVASTERSFLLESTEATTAKKRGGAY